MQKKYSEIKPGEVFAFGGQNWIRLEEAGLCVMEDILEERAFDEDSNDWRESELREYLNNYFYETLTDYGAEEKDFLMIETDLTADDGMKDYGTSKDLVSLMTADLYRSNRYLLKPLGGRWWLATPYSCLASGSYYVRYVYLSGTLGYDSAYNGSYGVRPLINLAQDAEVYWIDDAESVEHSIDTLTELIEQWAKDRGLDTADPAKQLNKLAEEVGELAGALIRQQDKEIIDALGDIYAVITVLAMQLGLEIEDCISSAFDVYKNRQGKIVDGTFIKEEDLAKLDERP